MAIRASSEIVIEASPERILEALADMEAVPSWSSVHKRCTVVDTHPDGRPHHVQVVIKVTGFVDREILEYHWGPDWVVWDAQKTVQQHGQHGEYNLLREGDDKTRVRFTITFEPGAPMPEFLAKKARKKILYAATEGLRQRVMGTATQPGARPVV